MVCGTDHTLMLTESGHVYSMGNNNKGQLGLDVTLTQSKSSPTLVESLSNFFITSISAGGDCSFAVTSSGSVFAWGDGNLGQLGLGNFMRIDTPQKVVFGTGRYVADAKI